MKRIYVIESLCNGCKLCETFCASLKDGVFHGGSERLRVLTIPGERKSIPMINCSGNCIRSIYEDGRPTCVGLCPTGALIFAELERGLQVRLEYEAAKEAHSLFKVVAPWKWPFPWRRPGEDKARSSEGDVV